MTGPLGRVGAKLGERGQVRRGGWQRKNFRNGSADAMGGWAFIARLTRFSSSSNRLPWESERSMGARMGGIARWRVLAPRPHCIG